MSKEIAYYIAPYDEIVFVYKDRGKIYAVKEFTTIRDTITGLKLRIPDVCGLFRNKINKTNWNKACKREWIVRLGVL